MRSRAAVQDHLQHQGPLFQDVLQVSLTDLRPNLQPNLRPNLRAFLLPADLSRISIPQTEIRQDLQASGRTDRDLAAQSRIIDLEVRIDRLEFARLHIARLQ